MRCNYQINKYHLLIKCHETEYSFVCFETSAANSVEIAIKLRLYFSKCAFEFVGTSQLSNKTMNYYVPDAHCI